MTARPIRDGHVMFSLHHSAVTRTSAGQTTERSCSFDRGIGFLRLLTQHLDQPPDSAWRGPPARADYGPDVLHRVVIKVEQVAAVSGSQPFPSGVQFLL